MALMPNALTTLGATKTYLGIDLTDTAQDSLVEMMINAVSAEIAGTCQRNFAKGDYSITIDGEGRQSILLPEYPLLSIAVTQDGKPITDFSRNNDSGIITRSLWLGTFTVQYCAGYVLPKDESLPDNPRTLPVDMEMACIELVAIRMNKRGSEHLSDETIGPLRSKFWADWPESVQSVIEKYKRWDMV